MVDIVAGHVVLAPLFAMVSCMLHTATATPSQAGGSVPRAFKRPRLPKKPLPPSRQHGRLKQTRRFVALPHPAIILLMFQAYSTALFPRRSCRMPNNQLLKRRAKCGIFTPQTMTSLRPPY